MTIKNHKSAPQSIISRRAFSTLLMGGAAALAVNPGLGAFAQTSGGTLTMALTSPPINLDPAKNGSGVNEAYFDPVYGALIHVGFDGEARPYLAESYSYFGEGNTGFEIKLRAGLKFADGTSLDSAAVKTYLDYYAVAGGPFGASVNVIESVETPDPLTVRINFKTGVPNAITQFSESGLWGSIPNPKVVSDNPDSLGSQPDGAGPYVLDANATIIGNQYVYTANPNFFDQNMIKWDKIVLNVIDTATARLQSLMSRQADVAELDAQTAAPARGAGMTLQSTNDGFVALYLQDRRGDILPAFGDVNFRKAINMAIDREGITSALYGDLGEPTQQITVPTREGYQEELESFYTYDPDTARQMIKDGGYEGTTFPMLVPTFMSGVLDVAQAVAAQLAEVGITMTIETGATFPAYVELAQTGRFPGNIFQWNIGNLYYVLQQHIMPDGVVNPLKSEDEDIIRMMTEIGQTNPADAGPLYDAVIARVVDLAWFAPVLRTGAIFAWNNRVETPLTGLNFSNPTMIEPTGA